MENIAVVGAGLVGSLLSIYLAEKGHKVTVFEKRPDMRNIKISAGRSINLAISDRGWRSLAAVGLEEKVRKIAIPMHGRMIHDENNNTAFMAYGKEGQFISSISRGELNKLLLTEAENHENIEIKFNQTCVDIDAKKASISLDNGEVLKFNRIFGADGAFSIVRRSLSDQNLIESTTTKLTHSYKELNIPPGENGSYLMEKNALHIWPRKDFMLIALPNLDGSFTVTLFLANEGEHSFETYDTAEKFDGFIKEQFGDAYNLIPNVKELYEKNPESTLATVRAYPWSFKDKVLLIGDAAHAIVPFYGQGMVSGFEDCRIFNGFYELYEPTIEKSWGVLYDDFQTTRKPDADAIADLALMNFIEMRDKVIDEKFLLKRKLTKILNEELGDRFRPLYSMATFSHIPYSKALERGKLQDRLLDEYIEKNNLTDIEDFDIEKFKELMKRK